MRGIKKQLFMKDGRKFDSIKEAAIFFELTPGRISHYIQEAYDEGRGYALVRSHRLYFKEPPKEEPKKPDTSKPFDFIPQKITLLRGHLTHTCGQAWMRPC